MSDLLPCPFCGGPGEMTTNGDWSKSIMCCKCGVRAAGGKPEQAIAAWNTRALTAASPADDHFGKPVGREYGASPEAPAHAEPVAWTGSGSLMAIKDGREGFIWPSKAEAHPIPLFAHPPTDVAEIERLTTRLKEEMALYAETDGKRRAAEARAGRSEAQIECLRDARDNYQRLYEAVKARVAELEALWDKQDAAWTERTGVLTGRIAELEVAIKVKGGSEHYPTEDAYLAACRAVEKHRARIAELEATLTPLPDAELDALVAQARTGIQTKTMTMREGETVDLVATFNLQNRLADAITSLRARPAGVTVKPDDAADFDRADWFWRTMDPDDCGDSPEEAVNRAMLGHFCVCEIASSFTGPTRYGFVAPVLDPESDDTEFVHFATQNEAVEAARIRAALTSNTAQEETLTIGEHLERYHKRMAQEEG